MRHLPNLITLLRMLATVPLAWLIREDRYGEALLLALAAGASDALDGFLAKRFGWQSWIGGVLDPLADKLLLTACFVSLVVAGVLPAWLAVLVLARDVIIVSGAVAYHNLIEPIQAQPTWLGKITTVVQIAFVLATLLHLADYLRLPPLAQAALFWSVVASTVASGIDYVLRWAARARRERRRRADP